MTIGFEGMNGVRTSGEKDSQEILDVFFSHGHTEVDTARIYAEGTTEQVRWCLICRPISTPQCQHNHFHHQVLANLDMKNATIDTKCVDFLMVALFALNRMH